METGKEKQKKWKATPKTESEKKIKEQRVFLKPH